MESAEADLPVRSHALVCPKSPINPMKPKSTNRFHYIHNTALVVLSSAITAITTSHLEAATWAWDGGAGTGNWNDGANWNPNIATVYPIGFPQYNQAPTVISDRINVNSSQALDYTSAQGHSIFGGATVRGLVIGSGSSGTMNLTGGIFSSQGNTVVGPGTQPNTADVVGNGNGTTAVLNINGGSYISGAGGLSLGLGGSQNASPSTSTLNIANGSATVTALTLLNNTATININSGGTLAANSITYLGWASFINFDGGTLRARTSTAAFFPDGSNQTARVKSGGATIDTDNFNVTISEPLQEDPLSTGGGLIKNGTGTLTLGNPSTVSGAVTVNAGGLGLKAGAASWQPASFTHSGTALNFDLGVFNPSNPPVLDVADLALNSAGITVNISGASIPISSEIRILDYVNKSGTGSLTLNIASLPVNMMATLEENTIEGYYYLNVTSPSAAALTWSGDTNADASGIWDTSELNWNTNSVAYAEPALVTFPNIAGGGTVTIPSNVAPLVFSIDNATTNNYTFTGSGKITGATGITKSGAGITTFDGAAHDYSGALAINSGAVVKNTADATTGTITVATNAALGLTGGITDGSGQTLSLSGPGLTVANGVFGAVQRGALQSVSGNNTWSGNITIPQSGTGLRIGTQ
jgi:autotransporter-associated beta strand protein